MDYIAIGIVCLAIAIVGVSEGFAASKALEGIARNPEAAGKIRGGMIIGLALIETCAIYILVIGLLVLFVGF